MAEVSGELRQLDVQRVAEAVDGGDDADDRGDVADGLERVVVACEGTEGAVLAGQAGEELRVAGALRGEGGEGTVRVLGGGDGGATEGDGEGGGDGEDALTELHGCVLVSRCLMVDRSSTGPASVTPSDHASGC
ncbi:MAG TPA: hypothetical protein DCM55_03265 [Corynebacterium variabile]|nr:hypothetical protein [Corynebacterium variabile]